MTTLGNTLYEAHVYKGIKTQCEHTYDALKCTYSDVMLCYEHSRIFIIYQSSILRHFMISYKVKYQYFIHADVFQF